MGAPSAPHTRRRDRVVATVDGRSARTPRLAAEAGLELLPDLDAVVAERMLVLSIVPPDRGGARRGRDRARARRRRRPLVADLERRVAGDAGGIGETLAAAGLELVDGSISGGPPRAAPGRASTSRARARRELAAGAPSWLDVRVVGEEIGLASAVKMCTASMYKGSTALCSRTRS